MTTQRDPPLQEREKTHGDFKVNAALAQDLKNAVRNWNVHGISSRQMEAIDLICTKIARIVSGDSKHKDHWLDLAGYAKLGSEACDG